MITLRRTTGADPDFQSLVRLLDAELAIRDGEEHGFYHQFNQTHDIKYAIVLYDDGMPAGCGAIKAYEPGTLEVKRMFVPLEKRSKGLASRVLEALEQWARELGNEHCILETGIRQPEAIRLYEKNGYTRIPNYGQYIGVENSVCFLKKL